VCEREREREKEREKSVGAKISRNPLSPGGHRMVDLPPMRHSAEESKKREREMKREN
jgi:hypothetical protein